MGLISRLRANKDELRRLRETARRRSQRYRDTHERGGVARIVDAVRGRTKPEPPPLRRSPPPSPGPEDPTDISFAKVHRPLPQSLASIASPNRPEIKAPGCLNRADRREFDGLELTVISGAVPDDLRGHYFAMAVTGGTEQGLPRGTQSPPIAEYIRKLLPIELRQEPTTTVLNSDAFILRFDIGETIKVKTRLGRGPDWYADAATRESAEGYYIGKGSKKHRKWIAKYAFRDSGLLRINWLLGLRNMNNTAFQPFPSKDPSKPPRLLVTWDAGQPWEIDTQSLELVTPVGRRSQWTAEALGHQPFKMVFTTAHPAWDLDTGEGFFINYGKGLLGLMNGLPVVRDLRVVWRYLDANRIRLLYDLSLDALVELEVWLQWFLTNAVQTVTPAKLEGLIPKRFLRVKVWDGESETLKTLNVQEDCIDVEIQESVHQLAITKNHVVIMDTGFKVGLNTLYGDAIPGMQTLSTVIRTYTTRTVRPYATVHIVNRGAMADSMGDEETLNADGSHDVESFRIDLPVAACHFLVDYEDTQTDESGEEHHRIVLHVAHCDATDVSEWLRSEDRGVIENDEVARELLGLPSLSGMDINRLARYTIDTDSKRLVEARILEQEPETWTLALYAHAGTGRPVQPPDTLRSVFWTSMGFFEDLAFGRLYGLYRNYIHRTVPVAGVRKMLEHMENQPATLFRVDASLMTIEDKYHFPEGWVGSSPQFAPRAVPDDAPRDAETGWRLGADGRAIDPEQDGYLLLLAYGPDRGLRQRVPELQIFKAWDLAAGPICRLFHEELVFGYGIHTAFLDRIGPRDEPYQVPVMEDLLRGQPKDQAEFLRAAIGDRFD